MPVFMFSFILNVVTPLLLGLSLPFINMVIICVSVIIASTIVVNTTVDRIVVMMEFFGCPAASF